jgi:hypothetical protein
MAFVLALKLRVSESRIKLCLNYAEHEQFQVLYLKIASKREQNQACLNYAEHEQFQVPCLKNAKKRIVINPLDSAFWRGYIDQERSIRPQGKYSNCEEVARLPEFKVL